MSRNRKSEAIKPVASHSLREVHVWHEPRTIAFLRLRIHKGQGAWAAKHSAFEVSPWCRRNDNRPLLVEPRETELLSSSCFSRAHGPACPSIMLGIPSVDVPPARVHTPPFTPPFSPPLTSWTRPLSPQRKVTRDIAGITSTRLALASNYQHCVATRR